MRKTGSEYRQQVADFRARFHRLGETHGMPWAHLGQRRPAFALDLGPGQESVWDYPRPPRLVADPRQVEGRIGESPLARSRHAIRVLETPSPPTWHPAARRRPNGAAAARCRLQRLRV